MAVVLTLSETYGGGAANDGLVGGGTGVDLGPVQNSGFAPVTDKANNIGFQNLYFSHNAVVDPVTDAKIFMRPFGEGTAFTYGGGATANADFNALVALGNGSGNSKNNIDGLSGGVWVDFNSAGSQVTQFDIVGNPTFVKIFGDNGTDGLSIASAFTIAKEAMVSSAGNTAATTPVDGTIGKAGDLVLGDAARVKNRIYITDAYPDGGVVQWETAVVYTFTA